MYSDYYTKPHELLLEEIFFSYAFVVIVFLKSSVKMYNFNIDFPRRPQRVESIWQGARSERWQGNQGLADLHYLFKTLHEDCKLQKANSWFHLVNFLI